MPAMNKYALPTISFPYKITNRLALMAIPRRQVEDRGDGMPKVSPITGVRLSALRGHGTERTNEVAWPYVKRLIMLRVMYRDKFPKERLEKVDRMIAAANSTMYSKLSNSVVIFRKTGAGEDLSKKAGKKKGWSESDWRKHMDYISAIANPRREIKPPPIDRGPHKPIDELLPRLEEMCQPAPTKIYKRISQEDYYRDPVKVSPAAMKYVISARVKKLAEPKTLKPPE